MMLCLVKKQKQLPEQLRIKKPLLELRRRKVKL